ncbi:ATP-binding protein [Wansuia hejianensis]|uniref:ATP-binding protein n=1 Tax=Wansuia hejianensis TaxID=2763667 RepID=A0A926F3Y2_9FIRM|nr:ATP-binding protein [Wansuia hejianensis]MBC8591517.1 ATP-binding protein [Wansuia hejianensis]
MNNDKRIKIIIGHYGSGKTEFSINYAVKLAKENKKVALVDLDVVNLYFRSREKAEILEDMGIKVIGSSIKASALDIPAISADVLTPLQDKSYEAIMDIGGDPAGARTLGRYHNYFQEGNYDMFFVLNANRPETQTVEKVMEYMTKIEDTSRAKITGIISNTHLLKSTTVDDVVKGYQLSKEVSKVTNVPLRYITVLEELVPKLPKEIQEIVFPIKLYMREEWML